MISFSIEQTLDYPVDVVHQSLSQIVQNVTVVPGATAVMFVAPPTRYRFMVDPAADVLHLPPLLADFELLSSSEQFDYSFSLQIFDGKASILSGQGTLICTHLMENQTSLVLAFDGELDEAYAYLSAGFVATQLRATARQLFENMCRPPEFSEVASDSKRVTYIGAIIGAVLLIFLIGEWIRKKKR